MKIPGKIDRVTKEFLLSKNTEETYMATYTHMQINNGLLVSTLRSDKRPTVSFYRNKKGELIYHDFGTGMHENFIGVVMFIFKCSYQQALDRIAEDFGYILSQNPSNVLIKISDEIITEKPDTIIQIEQKEFSQKELQWWASYGVHENTLKKFKVFSCASIFLNGNYFTSSTDKNFIFGYYGGKKDGHELWRIYQPLKRSFRFINNWNKYMLQGVKLLPSSNDFGILTKSLKDVMCLYEQNIPACAPCSENTMINQRQIDCLTRRFNNVYIMLDNDEPGRQAVKHYLEKFSVLKGIELKSEISKDISDACKKYSQSQFNAIINELKRILNQDENNLQYFNILN